MESSESRCRKVVIDFETDGFGNLLAPGDFAGSQWTESNGLTIFANSTANGMARIVDYLNPGTGLGTSNPGKILIIQSDNAIRDQNEVGGSITFSFSTPVWKAVSLGLVDIKDDTTFVEVQSGEASGPLRVDILGKGDNAYQSIALDFLDVEKVTVHFSTSGAVADFTFCQSHDFVPGPAPADVKSECSSRNFPCAQDDTIEICYFDFSRNIWESTCIDEPAWDSIFSVWYAYCGPCQEDALNPFKFIPKGESKVHEILPDAICKTGPFGAENIDVVESDGHIVKFTMNHTFCPTLDRMQLWFDDPTSESGSLCYEYENISCSHQVGSYTARCMNGWADINLIGERGSDFGEQMVEVPSPSCQDNFEFVAFNAQKRCYWNIRVPCSTGKPILPGRLLSSSAGKREEADISLTSAPHSGEANCEIESRAVDVLPIAVDRCIASDFDSPLKLLSQDKETVTFSISQVWKGCTTGTSDLTLGWLAADYIGVDDNLHCSKFDKLACGLSTTMTSKCSDGASVVDIYAYDSDPALFQQEDRSPVIVPSACGTVQESNNICHFRFIIKCEPSKCRKNRSSLQQLRHSGKES